MAEYEFTTEQNACIDQFRQKLFHISIFMAGIGVLILPIAHLAVTGVNLWLMGFGGMAFIVLGFVYFRPIDNFKRITTTEGHDVFEMMIAMDDLRVAFTTAQVIVIFMMGLLLGVIFWR